MNLDSCTPGQREIITTLDKPLMVSAGAGSGKTFTLTQRIAYALESESSGIDGIDSIMAITFTRKAAGELKARVKRRLLDLGREEDALKVDDAWISTIHGACSRILREHALELGIDPGFEVLSETDVSRLRGDAMDRVLDEVRESDEHSLLRFVNSIGMRSQSPNSPSVERYIDALTDRVKALPGGFSALAPEGDMPDARALLRRMVMLGETFLECLESLTGKKTKADEANRADVEAALKAANSYLDSAPIIDFSDPAFDAGRYARVFFSFPKTSPKYRTKDGDPSFFADYRVEYAELGLEAEAGLAMRELRFVVELAQRVDAAYSQLKGASRLDNTDLLQGAWRALEENPEICRDYRERFKMIMIDEFQDTDELQVALVRKLAAPDLSNVCTVGDAQQSIYRFRGADVNVFYGYRDLLEGDGFDARFVSLPDNFRSHADVLSCVDAIFSQPAVFGDRFLSLAPKGAINDVDDPLFASRPRISMAVFDYRRGGPGVAAATEACADRIAAHFADLRQAGAEPSSMVVLLGKMSNVDVYAGALRRAGFECIVAGGSTFSAAEEVGLVASLLRFLSNASDDEALYRILASELFSVGDAGLLHLTSRYDSKGILRRRPLSTGFAAWDRERSSAGLPEVENDRVDFAFLTLHEVQACARRFGAARALTDLLRRSGWLARLECEGARGQAVVGNLSKALRMVTDLEAKGIGLPRLADRFSEDCATLKLTPGTLATASSDFVRIMTVHASKGLEFDHVALGDMRFDASSSDLVAENIEGRTYLSMRPVAAAPVRSVVTALRGYLDPPLGVADEVTSAVEAGECAFALEEYQKSQELSEAHRLLYVALTRAVKSLFVGISYLGNQKGTLAGKGVLGDLHAAFKWDSTPDAPVQTFSYGASSPLCLEYTLLDKPREEERAPVREAPAFLIPARPLEPAPPSDPWRRTHEEVFSYSSIAPKDHGSVEGGEPALDPKAPQDAPMFVDPDFERADATALGSAFHRLAQRAIGSWKGGTLSCPDADAVAAQAHRYRLTAMQTERLHAALSRWFASDVARDLVVSGAPRAEVPFMVAFEDEGVFLEGEIDAFSVDDAGIVHLVDYKTGGSLEETSEALFEKHRLQASCYAYALFLQGYAGVEAAFVRVEIEDGDHPGQPQVQRYSFDASERDELGSLILSTRG